ncbi:unnamed protein product [Paramecium sonneborni]|uniref:hydroxymethylglutaryl-CoA lyase n=1 Tax=Paramecium sonneborni TaxID=65129 RepID=A0A8S1NUG4_9CILI|nr:unnamed protein product [Paramecium sonneborni]
MSRVNNLLSQLQKYKNIKLPQKVKIVEMGPRDGLQNEKTIVESENKIKFINLLSQCGFQAIETTSFVSKKWVPQMGDASEVYSKIDKYPNISYPVLVPNVTGLDQALKVDVKEIAVFGAASEAFSQKNINCSIADSLKRFNDVVIKAQQNGIKIRGYVSCVMGCPYEGDINPLKVVEVTQKLFEMGCYEVSLGDTIGVGTPEKTKNLMQALSQFDFKKLAVHFHDTYDRAIPNILVALEHGIQVVDSSVSGLGGCPYAGKPSGNVATETVINSLNYLGIETGIDKEKLKKASDFICGLLNRQNISINF